MGRAWLIFLLFADMVCMSQTPTVTVNDLLTLSSLSPKNVDSYLNKKGFVPGNMRMQDGIAVRTFFEKNNNEAASPASATGRSVDLYKKDNTWCFILQTTSENEYKEGRTILKNAGFFYDNDTSRPNSMIFKKGSITIQSTSVIKEDSPPVYYFTLQKKEFPDPGPLQYAEDLLKFDSHEHLAYYFGTENVKRDIYYFSEKESAKCSVLFPNSNRQVVFIWEDESNLHKISFLMISGVLQTASTVQYNGNFSQNAWQFRSGIYTGMRIKDLLKTNANDFTFYGRDSEFSFMVVPEKTRYIDFKRVGIMLDCFDCHSAPLLYKEKVSAAEAAEQDLAIYISCIMIRPQ